MRTSLTSVGELLFGQTRGRVLALLYGAPDETFFVRQIARQIETSVGTVQRELACGGVVRSSTVSSQILWTGMVDSRTDNIVSTEPSIARGESSTALTAG